MGEGNFYRPCSEACKGYVFTDICHSVIFQGGRWTAPKVNHLPTLAKITTPPPSQGHNTSPLAKLTTPLPPPLVRITTPPPTVPSSQHPPPPWPSSQHLPPGQAHNTSPPPLVRITTPPPTVLSSQHPPWPRSQHLSPPGQGHNTSPSLAHNTSPPPALCTGVWYTSYWNAFLFHRRLSVHRGVSRGGVFRRGVSRGYAESPLYTPRPPPSPHPPPNTRDMPRYGQPVVGTHSTRMYSCCFSDYKSSSFQKRWHLPCLCSCYKCGLLSLILVLSSHNRNVWNHEWIHKKTSYLFACCTSLEINLLNYIMMLFNYWSQETDLGFILVFS